MKSSTTRTVKRRSAGFTLAEVLAAMVFIAIVVPVAIHALNIASLAGQISEQKGAAMRVAERLLNESIVTTNWSQSTPRGTVRDGAREYEWTLQNDTWQEDQMRLLTVEVTYTAQGRKYSVLLSTLADGNTSASGQTTVMR